MKLTVEWRNEGPDCVTISQGGVGTMAARLIGVPFAAGGLYFLYQFLDAALHPSRGELTIAGWIALPLMAAALLVPGWAILVVRKRVRLDATRREASEETDFLVYTRRVTTMIPRDAHVMLRYEVGSRSDAATTAAHVYLVPSESEEPQQAPGAPKLQRIRLAMFFRGQTEEPLELAQRVARFLGIDVRDLRVEGGEVTAGGVVVDRLGADEVD